LLSIAHAHFPLFVSQARWRRGESVSLKSARDSMVSLEVAAHSQLALGKGSNFLNA
jgi:hypothetical protein